MILFGKVLMLVLFKIDDQSNAVFDKFGIPNWQNIVNSSG